MVRNQFGWFGTNWQCPEWAMGLTPDRSRTLWYMAGTTSHANAKMRHLGAELREIRKAKGLGVRELARIAGLRTHAHITLWEQGKRLPAEDDLARVLAELEVSDDERDRLVGMVREAQGPGRLTAGTPGIGDVLTQLIEHERSARRITNWSPLLLPGLLQTTDYARAIMGNSPHAETRVTLRAGRRDILTRRDPAEFVALIDSEVLVRPVVPRNIMIDQLRHLLEVGKLPNVTIQIVSSTLPGWHPGLAGPFQLIEFPKASPVVLLEHHRSSLFLWEADDVQEYVKAAEEVRSVAMAPADSAETIAWIVSGQETTTHDGTGDPVAEVDQERSGG